MSVYTYWNKPGTLQQAVTATADDYATEKAVAMGFKPITHAQWKFYCALLTLKLKIRRNK